MDLSTGADITKFVDFVKMVYFGVYSHGNCADLTLSYLQNKLDKDSGSDSDSS